MCLLFLLHLQVLRVSNFVQLVELFLSLTFEVVRQALLVLRWVLAVFTDHMRDARALLHDPRHLALGRFGVPGLGLLGVTRPGFLGVNGLCMSVRLARLLSANHGEIQKQNVVETK